MSWSVQRRPGRQGSSETMLWRHTWTPLSMNPVLLPASTRERARLALRCSRSGRLAGGGRRSGENRPPRCGEAGALLPRRGTHTRVGTGRRARSIARLDAGSRGCQERSVEGATSVGQVPAALRPPVEQSAAFVRLIVPVVGIGETVDAAEEQVVLRRTRFVIDRVPPRIRESCLQTLRVALA